MVKTSPYLLFVDKTCSFDNTLEQAKWLFSVDNRMAIECFKTKTIDPFVSSDVLNCIKQYGGVKHILSYLEYVVLERSTKVDKLHTELSCLYVQCISSLVRKIKEQVILAQGEEEELSEFVEQAPLSHGNAF